VTGDGREEVRLGVVWEEGAVRGGDENEGRVPKWELLFDTPGVFVRVATTGLTGAEAVRVANNGLKVAVFSEGCGAPARVANKGLTGAFCWQKSNWIGPDGFGGVRRTAWRAAMVGLAREKSADFLETIIAYPYCLSSRYC